MDDLDATRGRLFQLLGRNVAADPLGALPTIARLQRETDEHLRDAVRRAARTASWSEIASGLGVSKQAAHQRFKAYATDVTAEIKREQRALRRSRRDGDPVRAAQAQERRDDLVAGLRTAAEALEDER